jgi:hypothetical protein
MLLTYCTDSAVGVGASVLLSLRHILSCVVWLVFTFPRFKLNAIKLDVMMHTFKSLCCQQINENSHVGSVSGTSFLGFDVKLLVSELPCIILNCSHASKFCVMIVVLMHV